TMGTVCKGSTAKVGVGGAVNGYAVLVVGDVVVVERDGAQVTRSRVEGLARFVAARGLTIGWGKFPDGARAIVLYEKGARVYGYDGFGSALNVGCDWSIEWGCAPFGR